MDHNWFFVQRIEYIRNFYSIAVLAFRQEKEKIENAQPPFDNPPYSEDGEPPYLSEWIDADTSEDVLGRACVSMLSDALKIYLNSTREDDLRFDFEDKNALKKGFARPHLEAFCVWLKIPIEDCPVSIDLLEQVVLARNKIQHGSILTSLDIDHDQNTLNRFPKPLFVDPNDIERDRQLNRPWYSTKLTVTEASLSAALDECIKLTEWIGPVVWGPSWPQYR